VQRVTDQPTESSPGADTAAETPEPTSATAAPATSGPAAASATSGPAAASAGAATSGPASATAAPATSGPATSATSGSADAADSGPAADSAPTEYPASVATQYAEPPLDISWIPVQRAPKVVIKADLLPALSLALLLAVFGLPLGWIWSRIAPPERVGMSSNGAILPLIDETYHPWDDVAIYLLMGLAFGLVAGVAVWLLRERRGPTVMVAAVLGAVAAGWLMTKTGVSFAAGDYTTPASLKIGTLFDLAPQLNTWWVLLAPPLGVALAYLVLSAWSGSEDLGRRLG
jgi:hypothetical protein